MVTCQAAVKTASAAGWIHFIDIRFGATGRIQLPYSIRLVPPINTTHRQSLATSMGLESAAARLPPKNQLPMIALTGKLHATGIDG